MILTTECALIDIKRKTQVAVQWVAVCQEWCKIKENLYIKSVSFNNERFSFTLYQHSPIKIIRV
jgi:hypothetical protein